MDTTIMKLPQGQPQLTGTGIYPLEILLEGMFSEGYPGTYGTSQFPPELRDKSHIRWVPLQTRHPEVNGTKASVLPLSLNPQFLPTEQRLPGSASSL